QEYTALKIAVKEWPESAQEAVSQLPKDAKCFFVAATLRPETVYGQLCCFVGPSIRYGIYKVSNDEYFVLSERAARNMSFQGVTAWGEVEKIVDVLGSDLVGAVVAPPLSANPEVRILPMESVKASKGTGIVMCVPSDSPDDYITLRDLAKKADYYGIRKEWADLEIIPIIETPTYGNLTAKAIVEQMKINSPKDAKQLAEAKDLAYKEGFYRGVMIYGPFKGKTVEEAKSLVRAQLLEAGEALAYAETDGMVVSRSGDECVAAHLDQWYMAYGKKESPEWQQEVLSYVTDGEFNSYSADTKNALEANLDWLGQ
ncbi:cytosolic leucyl tRNA synthetase, partial [Cryomyces antarcticus]